MLYRVALAVLLLGVTSARSQELLLPIPPIPRLLPPVGEALPEETSLRLQQRLATLAARIAKLQERPLQDNWQRFYLPDILVLTKAVDFAIRNQEFYDHKKDIAKAEGLLDEAQARIEAFEKGEHPWTTAGRFVVRGYRSTLDQSPQPYGLVFPADYDPQAKKKYPLYIWLHGRGDKATDLHFLHERRTQLGQLGEVPAIVLHAFGRQCVGFKGAGGLDVLESRTNFLKLAAHEGIPVDPERVVLIGFSMGGAGAWQVGAHHAGEFIAVAPGAGFAETARYTNTKPDSVPWYESTLWGMNDVSAYTRNLFNTETIAYSGENDKQIQAARIMEEAFQAEGRTLTHLIGPGVEHKYEPATLHELKQRLQAICDRESVVPHELHLQTRTLRYSSMHWLQLHGLEKQWSDIRVDAQVKEGVGTLETKNVTRMELRDAPFKQCSLDGQTLQLLPNKAGSVFLGKENGSWKIVPTEWTDFRKNPSCMGPIDDAFNRPFLVVAPSGKSKNALVQRWVEFELPHFIDRWRTLMRAEVPQVRDVALTSEQAKFYNLIAFGDPDSNLLVRRTAESLPVTWKDSKIVAGEQSFSAEFHLPALIYPNPLNAQQVRAGEQKPTYIVVNSGLTYRESHDKTNSQQNPKLPDWAVLDLRQLPNDKSPAAIAAAGFFDESWQLPLQE